MGANSVGANSVGANSFAPNTPLTKLNHLYTSIFLNFSHMPLMFINELYRNKATAAITIKNTGVVTNDSSVKNNAHILEKNHLGLQDTNDTFLANMQKDGTYSVVPRIAGGEISPDMLIVLGQVGKKYQLYTKITGGQRVDLFGARVDQLPHIWKELIDAGFESGHAYGKSLRTVKSCVGSTWCRYGVEDSMGLAIELENRYKGLRSPHKIKFGVSGCTRECAEAQGKDIGIIATENGWNLYVCGNGGMKPRHADLFATGLDKKTLIKLIDRFLGFYIRTAGMEIA